jgi:hypothetical protein
VELLHAGYSADDDVDLARLKQSSLDPKHFIVVNYQRRVETVLKIRDLLVVNTLKVVRVPFYLQGALSAHSVENLPH